MESIPKILIVDNDPKQLKILYMLLTPLNVAIIQACSGPEALEYAKNQRFAMVLLDIHMPEMNGYEVAKKIFQDPQNKNCPIIFVTGAYYDEIHQLEGYITGAVDYITKPFSGNILLSKVKVFLKLYQQQIILETLYGQLKSELDKTKKHSNDLITEISENTLNKADLVSTNALMAREIIRLNQENQKLHQYIESLLTYMEKTKSQS